MFEANPHPNPIIIMASDMKFRLISNLLQFIYIGSVNIEQTELQEFMRIAETLQIKGLSTSAQDCSDKSNEDEIVEAAELKSGIKIIVNKILIC